MDATAHDDLGLLAQALRGFCAADVIGHARAWDEAAAVPDAIVRRAAELGLLGLGLPESAGGPGLPTAATVTVLDLLARSDGGLAALVAGHALASEAAAATPGHARGLDALAEGTILAAWAHGEFVAVREGSAWIVRGTAPFVIAGARADLFGLVARLETSAEQAAFVVERDRTVAGTRALDALGLRSAGPAEVRIEARGVPVCTGDAAGTLADRHVLYTAAIACGVGRGALAAAVAYAKERKQFGRPIAEFQAIQWKLANAATELEAAWMLVGAAAGAIGTETFAGAARRAHAFATGAAVRAGNDALQVHGGYGYTREFPVERALRDATTLELMAGGADQHRFDLAGRIAARGR